MEIKTNAPKASWLPLMLVAFVFQVDSSEPALLITRHNSGDIFAQVPDVTTRCIEETCVGMSSGTAIAISTRDLCTCRCHSHLPAFREDLGICVDDIHECVLSPFVGGSTSQQIPFVYLPLRGQIIHPGKAISFRGIQAPVCAVSGAKYVTEDGWVDLRNPADSDVPFRIVRDEGRALLQWSGESELRNRMSGRLIMVNMMCREMSTTESTETPRVQMIFSPCVAFRVVGTPMKYLTNVSEVAFAQDSRTESSSVTSEPMSVTEYVAIGICSVLLGLIYVASVFLYLHLRKRNKGSSEDKSGDDKSIRGIEEGIVKNNPLLSMPGHFIQGDQTYSDTNSSDNDAAPDIIKHYEERKKQITSALVHPQNQKFSFNSHRPSFSSFELSHQDSATNERLPEENVSIVETLEGREERPDNIRALSGSTRKKLYFNPAYFEPHLLMAPPPAALEFLTKIREVISIAKQKLSSKRFTPSLINIPEEDNHYIIDPIYGFANPASRRNSIISLKRENSRRRACARCPGCDPPDLKSLSGKLPEFPSLAACHSCAMSSNESKQRSIRKWLEDVPVLKDSSAEASQSAVKPARCPKRVRSPTKSLPADDDDGNTRALSPKPASENNSKIARGCNGNPPRKLRRPPPPPAATRKLTEEENIYDTIAMEIKRCTSMQFPPPDMIQQAMEVERSEEKVATLTKEQMNAVINEFTIHKNLIIPFAESELLAKHASPVDYETDSLERTGNKGYSTPSDYADVSSSQPSPSLSTVLPDQEEMTMRNAIYNKRTGNLTISKINMDILQEDDHDYELIVMKKGAIIDHGSYKLPELLQGNNRYSLVSEVYVNSGYNYGSAPSTPGGSRYSTMDKKTLKVRYENGVEKPGKLLIEVEDCLDHYIPVHDSDEYETDTLDRKPSKNKISDSSLERGKNQEAANPERPTQILLRTTGSFRSDAKALVPFTPKQPRSEPPEESNFNRVFGSLREIYEAKTRRSLFKKGADKKDCCTVIGDEEKGRTLTLEERHARRQRAKGAIVQPDVIPPPPHGNSPVCEHNHPAREALETDDAHIKSPLPSKNSNGRSASSESTKSNATTCIPTSTPSGTPDQPSEDYELCLLQKSKKNGTITNLIQTENFVLKKDSNNNQFVLHSMLHQHAKKKKQPRPWSATMKPDDSGYLSSDSNESRSAKAKDAAVDHGSETDESLGDGHSESGAESVETHSVFFGRFPRNMALFRGYGSTDSGVMGGEEGPSSSDSENVSYTTVVPVTKT